MHNIYLKNVILNSFICATSKTIHVFFPLIWNLVAKYEIINSPHTELNRRHAGCRALVQVFRVSHARCLCAQSPGISVSEGESVSVATNGLFWSPICVWFQSCRVRFHRSVCVCVSERVEHWSGTHILDQMCGWPPDSYISTLTELPIIWKA